MSWSLSIQQPFPGVEFNLKINEYHLVKTVPDVNCPSTPTCNADKIDEIYMYTLFGQPLSDCVIKPHTLISRDYEQRKPIGIIPSIQVSHANPTSLVFNEVRIIKGGGINIQMRSSLMNTPRT